jgi:uncharacterized caspase-like protein
MTLNDFYFSVWLRGILVPHLFSSVLFRALTALSLTACTIEAAVADKRVALVIGNSAYQHVAQLTNPANDIASALKKLGFVVIQKADLTKTATDNAVREFSVALNKAELGLFFFAGHGLQHNGRNYLMPVDARVSTAAALGVEMIRLEDIQKVMEASAKTNIIFLDACRDNPIQRSLAPGMGTRSLERGRGLAAAEAGVGTLISYATQPGNVALDGRGRNSPFAGALSRHILKADVDLNGILISVRKDVMTETAGRQVPWEHSALTGLVYFRPGTTSTKRNQPDTPDESGKSGADAPTVGRGQKCSASAISQQGGVGGGVGASEEVAVGNALASCEGAGGRNCRILAKVCR